MPSTVCQLLLIKIGPPILSDRNIIKRETIGTEKKAAATPHKKLGINLFKAYP
jgi:hypothetical protein